MEIVGVPMHYPPPFGYAVPVNSGGSGGAAKGEDATAVHSSNPWVINSSRGHNAQSGSNTPANSRENSPEKWLGIPRTGGGAHGFKSTSPRSSKSKEKKNSEGRHSRTSSNNGELQGAT